MRWKSVVLGTTGVILGVILILYGVAKILGLQFNNEAMILREMNPPTASLTLGQLTWLFYGASRPYQLFLGCAEVVVGGLVLMPSMRLLGAIFCFPILLNIVLIDWFYNIPTGALIVASFLLVLDLIILVSSWSALLSAVRILCGSKEVS